MISNIRLQNFRSYTEGSFELGDGVNIVVGPNASGKTNLLESVLVLALGSSYRAKDRELIGFGKPWARVEALTDDGDNRVVYIESTGELSKKQYKIGGQSLGRLNISKTLPVVVFEPNHLQLINGPPDLRRQFVDDLLEQTSPGFTSLRRRYRRALAQRNSLLKHHAQTANQQLFAWNVRLSELGSGIVEQRIKLIDNMNAQAQDIYNQLAKGKAKVEFSYTSNIPQNNYASELLKQLELSTSTDIARGFTTRGPHRDDISISLNKHPAAISASRGEVRTLLLVCKMLEAALLETEREQRPILLFDDVFSELDNARRQALTKFLKPYQSFITTTDADVVVQHFTESTNVIALN